MMLSVLDAPVRAEMGVDRPHLAGQAADKVLLCFLEFAVDFAAAVDAPNGGKAVPRSKDWGIVRYGQYGDFSRLAAVAILFGRFALSQVWVLVLKRPRERLLQFHLQRFLIAFHDQHIVRVLGHDLIRCFTLTMHRI